jgi:nitrogen fixation protein NifB
VLKPRQAIAYLAQVLEQEPRITVAGIAGPGDPFANPRETLETVRLIRERFPDLLLCLATNGLGLPPFLEELAEIKVSHVTLTVNAVDPEIGARIYSWVRDGKVIYRGLKAAEVLFQRQLESITGLKARGITVKVNTIIIPGINDRHVPAVARKMAELGVDILNCMPVFPNADTPFGHLPEPRPEEMARLRREAEPILPQMHHCTRCRADAVGLLDADRAEEFRGCLTACARQVSAPADRPYVAVATREGVLVNLHLGEASSFQVWGPRDGGFQMLEERPAPRPGGGAERWWALADILRDCRAVLVSGMGDTPQAILNDAGVEPVVMNGFIEMALAAIYGSGDLSALKGRRAGVAGGCGNKRSGEGCG